MAALILPSRWTRQPQGAVEVDWASPLTRGLVACVNADLLVNLADNGNKPTLAGNITRGSAESGLGFVGAYQSSDNYVKLDRTANLAYTSEVTFEALVSVRAFQTVSFPYISGVIGQYQSDGGGTPYRGPVLRFNPDATSGNATVPCFLLTQAAAEKSVAGAAQSVNRPVHLIGTYKSGSLDLYVNGVRATNSAVTGDFENHSSTFVSLLSDFVVVGLDHNRCLNGVLHLAKIYNRWMSPDEAHALTSTPWQIFRPLVRRIYFDLGAGGSAVGVTSIPRWDALAYAPKSSTVRWNAVVTAGDSRGVRWNMLAAVGQSSLLRWDAIAVAAKSSTPRWDALTTANKASIPRWDALTTAANTSTPRWNALVTANKSESPRWDSLTIANKSSTPRWDALVTANKSQAIRWDMLSSVILAGTDVTLRWNSIGIAQKLATARWNSVIAVPKDTTPRWNALTTASKSASTRWDLIAVVQKTVAPHWNLLATAGLSDALRWNMTQAVAQAVAARWNLVSTVAVAQTVTLRWHSISVSGKNVVCRWQVGDTGNTHYSYIDVLVLPEENRVMVLQAPNNVITIH